MFRVCATYVRGGIQSPQAGPVPGVALASPRQVMAEPLVTAAQLLEALRGLALGADPRCAEILAGADDLSDPVALTGRLAQSACLTSYQAKLLLEGRGAELVIGNYNLLEPVGAG